MVQEELQQCQVVRAEVSSQEEIAAESAVEVLHQRAGPDRPGGQLSHRGLDLVEPTAKSLLESCVLGPASRVALVARHGPEDLPGQVRGDLELLPEPLQLLVKHASEGQQVVPLV